MSSLTLGIYSPTTHGEAWEYISGLRMILSIDQKFVQNILLSAVNCFMEFQFWLCFSFAAVVAPVLYAAKSFILMMIIKMMQEFKHFMTLRALNE